jgi:predicted nucleic acid-binding protein
MKRVFVDANVFLRFFTVDREGHHELAVRLFDRATAGEILLVTGPPVLFEVAWTLRSAYGLSREQVLDVLWTPLGGRGSVIHVIHPDRPCHRHISPISPPPTKVRLTAAKSRGRTSGLRLQAAAERPR